MRMVQLSNNIVQQILPNDITLDNVAQYYNEDFAAQCVEAPDHVEQRWVYDPEAGTFSEPKPPEIIEPPVTDEVLREAVSILLGERDDELDDIIGS